MPTPAAAPRPARRRQRGRGVRGCGGERGAVLVQTAIMLVGLTAMSAFVVDYGVMWTARRQIQNAADAAAMAAALSVAFDVPGDLARARANAIIAAANNPVWGQPASLTGGDIVFTPCPVGAIGVGTCVRVEAFRDLSHGSQVPTVFGPLVGIAGQDVRATATAQVLYGDAADCVKPLALPDRWEEFRNDVGPFGWDASDTFERYRPNGQLLPGPVDAYTPPSGGAGPNGSGFSRGPTPFTVGDYGQRFEVMPAAQPLTDQSTAQRFLPVQVDGAAGPAAFLQALTSCSARIVRPGDVLQVELANIDAPLQQGVQALIDRDPSATWDFSLYGGRGGVTGGCMASGDCTISPRIVALPVYSPDLWDLKPPGTARATVTRLVGFFIDHVDVTAISGWLMMYPVTPRSSMTSNPTSSFVASVTLVR